MKNDPRTTRTQEHTSLMMAKLSAIQHTEETHRRFLALYQAALQSCN